MVFIVNSFLNTENEISKDYMKQSVNNDEIGRTNSYSANW